MQRKNILILIVTTILLIGLIVVYFNIDPAQTSWMPKCPSKLISGYDCPACGVQRAFHAILHGDIKAAWGYNAFLFLGVPYLLLAIWGSYEVLPGHARAHKIAHNPWMVYGYIVVFFAWWIIRNII